MINKKTEEFFEQLAKLINESGLPPVNVRLVLDLVRAQILDLEHKAVEQETEQEANKEEAR